MMARPFPDRLWIPLLGLCALLVAGPTGAAIDLGNLGIPGLGGGPLVIDPGGFVDPTPEVPPLPPLPEPLLIGSVGNDFLRVVTNTGGGTHSLYRQVDGGAFQLLQQLPADTRTEILQEGLRVGTQYCYRLDSIIPGGVTRERFRCATTEWRVGFSGYDISEADTARVMSLFDWRDTEPLPGGDELPALYYMNAFIDDVELPQGLRDLGIHVEPMPVFGEELAGWAASSTLVRENGAITGRWVYAIVPGHFYNQIRERVLEQLAAGTEPGIRALVFRQLPLYEAREYPGDAHRVSYQYLGERGFEFNGEINTGCVYNADLDLQLCPRLLGWIANKLGGWLWEGAESLVEGIRWGIGQFQLIYTDDADIDVTFRLLNTDTEFGTDRVMRSGWSGRELRPADMRVHVRQGLAAFYDHTDSVGRFRERVLQGVDTQFCIEAENHVVELTEFLTEETVCFASIGELDGDLTGDINVSHPYLNVVAAMTDAHDYLLEVADYNMPKITVLAGPQANRVALAGRSFAPCMGRMPGALGLLADVVSGPLLPLAVAAEFVTAVDIVLRTDSDDSRGVAVHEYGHAVMCDLLASQGVAAFQIAWNDVILATADQSPGNDTSYINEAFADFLTSQVVGGTNYFSPSNDVTSSHSMNYCESGSTCVEENFRSESSFENQVARITSLLHDAFDGGDAHDGSYWEEAGPILTRDAVLDSDDRDESVALARTDLRALFDHWDARGAFLDEATFLGGLADLAATRGYSEGEICRLFAIHDDASMCPGYVTDRPWIAWLVEPTSPFAGVSLFSDAALPPATGGGLAIPSAWLAIAPTAPSAQSGPIEAVTVIDAAGVVLSLSDLPLDVIPDGLPGSIQDAAEPEYPIAVVSGTQKVKLAGFGKDKRESAFAFRIGEGWWEAIDPLGQRLGGGWTQRGKKGVALRMHLAPEFEG
ncbi:MAG: hypothetical protein ACR2PQ_01155, partial [Myxococcota bacterium]